MDEHHLRSGEGPDRSPRTLGKVRGLATASTSGGIFTILAIDHRDSMRVVLDPEDPFGIPASELTRNKLELLDALGPEATAVMLEPEFSAAQAIAARALPGHVGFLAAVEAQGYLGDPTARQTSLLDGWSVEVVNTVGAGDAFAAGLIRSRLGGWDWYRSARFANACGAIEVTRHGCSAAFPTEAEVTEFAETHGGL